MNMSTPALSLCPQDRRRRRLPRALMLIALVCACIQGMDAAHPTLEQITKTWTGIEKSGSVIHARKFKLELKAGPQGTTSDGTPLSEAGGLSVIGTWISEPLMSPPGVRLPVQTDTVTGRYLPQLGLLTLGFKPGPQRPGGMLLIVFDEAGTRLAGISGVKGPFGEPMPVYANAGDGFGPELAGITGQRAVVSRPAPAATEDAALRARRDALQRELMAARPPVHTLSREQLLEEQKRLQPEVAKAMQTDPMRAAVLSQRMGEVQMALHQPAVAAAGRRTPEPAERWALQVAHYGSTLRFGNDPLVLAQLFSPRYFEPFFGKPFAAMSAAERQRAAKALQDVARHRDSAVAQSPLFAGLVAAFGNKPEQGFDHVYAGVGGLALEMIAAWDLRVLADFAARGDTDLLVYFEGIRARIGSVGWPILVEAAQRHLVETRSGLHLTRLFARMDEYRVGAEAGGSPLVQLAQLGIGTGQLTEADEAKFKARHEAMLDEVFAAVFAAARPKLVAGPQTMDTLREGVRWYRDFAHALDIAAERPVVREFVAAWRAARVRAIEASVEELVGRIDGAGDDKSLEGLLQTVRLAAKIDDNAAPAWRTVEEHAQARRKALAWARHVARVGEGPFGPEHPGAAYLNAIWRNDHEQIRREDALHIEPILVRLRGPMNSGILEAAQTLGIGLGMTADQMRAQIEHHARRASLVRVVAAVFILEYQLAYPKCDELLKGEEYKVTSEWTVHGSGRYRSIRFHQIKTSHERAFLELDAHRPVRSVLVDSMRNEDALAIGDIIDGTVQAMRKLRCHEPDMVRFETNLMAMFSERFLR